MKTLTIILLLILCACESPVCPEISTESISILGTWYRVENVKAQKSGIVFFEDGTAYCGYISFHGDDFLGYIPSCTYTFLEQEQTGFLKVDIYTTVGKIFTVADDSLHYNGNTYTRASY